MPFIENHLNNKDLFIGLSETWLHNHLEAELHINNYTIFRSDRNRKKTSKRGRHGGGVAIYLRNDIAATSETLLQYSNGVVDILAVYSKAENLIITTLYRQPDDSAHNRPSKCQEFKPAILALQKVILELDVMPDIIIGGDFNLPHARWPVFEPNTGCPKDEREMLEVLQKFSDELLLSQMISKPTHYQGNTLDLVLTNCKEMINDIEIQPTTLSTSHHYIINLFTQYKAPLLPGKETQPRLSPLDDFNFHNKETNWEGIQAFLGQVDWENLLQDKTADEILEIIYEKTLEAAKEYVPARNSATKQIPKHKRVRMNLTRKRRRINKQYQKATAPTRKKHLYDELIQIEVKLQQIQRSTQSYQEKKACEAVKTNSKYFFSYAKKKRKVKSNVGPILDKSTNTMTTNPKLMAELLADQYDSVFSVPSTNVPTTSVSQEDVNTITDIAVSCEEIVDAIKELRPSAASGPDGFPAILLTNCHEQLAKPLATLWQSSINNTTIPSKLKFSIIPPIHKGGSKSNPANYRPVALTSHIIKIFEKILRNKLAGFLDQNNLMNENQHGFRPGRSCLTQLLSHHDNIISLLEQGNNVDVVYLDFAKAFDKVDHRIVLAKAFNFGIRGKLLSWIKEFLSNRTQSVIVNGTLSSPRPVISGVPQGSVIGPLIFLILISDIDKNTLHSKIASFADDTRATNGIKCENDAVNLQEDLFHIYQWSVTNNMQFNDLKFELLRYGKDAELKLSTAYISPSFNLIEEKPNVKDLGVTLSSDATFKTHINNIVESAKNMASWILRTFQARDPTTILTLYKSLVRPILEYSSVLWTPIQKGEIQRLEEIQQSILRKIKGISSNYNQALKQLKLYSLERRRERYIVIQIWKMIEGIVPSLNPSLIQQSSTQQRRGRMLQVHKLASTPSHLLQIKRQSVRCFGVKLFNSLPKHIRNITNTSVDKFKRKLDTFLNTIDDHPHLRSGANQGSYSSNHLYDCITLNNCEQSTPGVPNCPPTGEANMSRGLSASETITLMQ